jgi:hypothetical protein
MEEIMVETRQDSLSNNISHMTLDQIMSQPLPNKISFDGLSAEQSRAVFKRLQQDAGTVTLSPEAEEATRKYYQMSRSERREYDRAMKRFRD